MPSVFVTRHIPEEAMEIIRKEAEVRQWAEHEIPVPREVLLQAVREVEGLLCLTTERIDGELLSLAPRLMVVSTCAVGYDNIDVAACTARGVMVGNTPGVLTETTADLTWALLMAAARRVVEGDHVVREGRWGGWSLMHMVGTDVYGATLGIVGFGRIGQAVARRAAGFGMSVLYFDRDYAPGATKVTLEELMRASDFVSVNVSLSGDTHHMIGENEIALMKPTAVFVNTSRGPVVDQAALTRALQEGRIAAAGLDVFEVEPLAPDDPLTVLDNVVLTPHIGSASVRTRTAMACLAAENLTAGIHGRPLPCPVNPEVTK